MQDIAVEIFPKTCSVIVVVRSNVSRTLSGSGSINLHSIPSLVGGFGSSLVRALLLIALIHGVLLVDSIEGGVEASRSFGLALRPVALMEVGLLGSCTYSPGRLGLALEVVVAEGEAVGTLSASLEVDLLGDLQVFFKPDQAV